MKGKQFLRSLVSYYLFYITVDTKAVRDWIPRLSTFSSMRIILRGGECTRVKCSFLRWKSYSESVPKRYIRRFVLMKWITFTVARKRCRDYNVQHFLFALMTIKLLSRKSIKSRNRTIKSFRSKLCCKNSIPRKFVLFINKRSCRGKLLRRVLA